MPLHVILQAMTQACWGLFVFAFGACVGSLINVIAYRMPKGLNIVTPASRCPSCDTKLTWRENIPILGWLILRGRCRFCRSKISPEYPIVETVVAVLFLLLYATWYFLPVHLHLLHQGQTQHGVWLGIDWSQFRPEWTAIDAREAWPRHTWPTLATVLVLVGSLVAMTLVDAKTFTIPLEIPWFATLFAVVVHTAHAVVVQAHGIRMPPLRNGDPWFIPCPDNWGGVLMTFGALVGLGAGILLIQLGLIRRSYLDYDEWEKKTLEEMKKQQKAEAGTGGNTDPQSSVEPGTAGSADEEVVGGPEMWPLYPHARREALKEIIFLTPCLLLGYVGWMVGKGMVAVPPLWVQVFAGAVLGYLAGGGIVWITRIGGSLGFGKEAMGLGDAHLLGAVGAALGWLDAVLAFFGAAFVGLFWWILQAALRSKATSRQLPYGPHLAVATVLVLLLKPLLCKLLALLNIPAC